MIKIRMEQQGNTDVTNYKKDKEHGGFTWRNTPEEFQFWNQVINYGKYDIFFKLYPHLKSEEFSNQIKDPSLVIIDYTDPYWWKILEEGDELIVDELKNTLNITWSFLKIGTILKVTKRDIEEIENKEPIVCFDNNRCGVNFTYNMVKLHKKKKLNNNNNDVSSVSNSIQRCVGSNGINLPSRECKIATGSRLAGTTTCGGPSQTIIKSGVLAPFQHI